MATQTKKLVWGFDSFCFWLLMMLSFFSSYFCFLVLDILNAHCALVSLALFPMEREKRKSLSFLKSKDGE